MLTRSRLTWILLALWVPARIALYVNGTDAAAVLVADLSWLAVWGTVAATDRAGRRAGVAPENVEGDQ